MLMYCLYLLMSFSLFTSDCYKLNKILCEGSLCVYLYQSDSHSLSWDSSYTTCRSENLEMLRIESSQTQTIVERLLQDLPSGSQGQLWIGGRRSTDDGWRFMNGTEFNKQVTNPRNEPRPYCLYVKLCKTRNPEYVADTCDEKYGNSALLCQRDPDNTGKCSSGYSLFGNKCYLKTLYDGKNPNKIDWYTGETFCSQSDIQGDIAYSYLGNDTLTNNFINLVKGKADCAQLWIGVRERIWFWKTDQSRDVDNPAIRYFHWFDGTTATSAGDCIYIDKDKGYKWLTQSCSTNLKYCICMKKSVAVTTTGTTSTTTSTSTTTAAMRYTSTRATVTDDNTWTALPNDSSTDINESKKFNLACIAPVIVSVILCAVVIAETAYCLWLRRKLSSLNTDHSVTEGRPNATRPESDTREDPEYEMTGDQNRQIDTSVSPEHIEMTTDSNQYEKPTVYINMVDRRNEYESLNG